MQLDGLLKDIQHIVTSKNIGDDSKQKFITQVVGMIEHSFGQSHTAQPCQKEPKPVIEKKQTGNKKSEARAKTNNSQLFKVEKQIECADNLSVNEASFSEGQECNSRKRKICHKYKLHTDQQRIDLMYDLMHHNSSHVELSIQYDINYTTIRNMYDLYVQQVGLTYKHQRMYTDINNPVLRVAINNDKKLAGKLHCQQNNIDGQE